MQPRIKGPFNAAQSALQSMRALTPEEQVRFAPENQYTMSEAPINTRAMLGLPRPVADAMDTLGNAARAFGDPMGSITSMPGVSLAAAPLMLKNGEWVRGAEQALGTMETGKPFASKAWSMQAVENEPGRFWFDKYTTPLSKFNVREMSSNLDDPLPHRIFGSDLKIMNPLVIDGDQMTAIKQLKIKTSAVRDMDFGAMDELIEAKAKAMGHDAVVYKIGTTLRPDPALGSSLGHEAPEIHYLGDKPAVKALKELRVPK